MSEPAKTPSIFRPKVQAVTIPAGTQIAVRTTSTLSTKTNQPGETFAATLTQPLMAGEKVIVPAGAEVEGRVASSDAGGKVKGRASIGVRLTSVELANGQQVDIATGMYVKQASGTKRKDAAKIGIGSGKGAAIGAGAGAGAGTGAVLLTRGDAAVIPSESVITFRLSEPVTVRL